MNPNFFIVGAPKCGTTAWTNYIADRPDVFIPDLKEPGHFNTDLNVGSYKDRNSYLALYSQTKDAIIIGDCTVDYLFSEVAAENIYNFNSDAKILIMLRAQEDQLPSLHNHRLFNGADSIVDFEQAWRLSECRDESNTPRWCREPKLLDYKAGGRFYEQVERYFRVFPAKQIRVFHFEDWIRQPRTFYIELLDFLGLPDDGRTEFPAVNEARRHRIQLLGSFMHSPPPWALKISRVLTRISGRRRPPMLDLMRALNRTRGYGVIRPTPPLIDEIRAYYAADRAALQTYIWRPETGTSD